jgi:hypothetical protein
MNRHIHIGLESYARDDINLGVALAQSWDGKNETFSGIPKVWILRGLAPLRFMRVIVS